MEVGGLTNFYFNLWVRPTFFTFWVISFKLTGFLCVIRVSKESQFFFSATRTGLADLFPI